MPNINVGHFLIRRPNEMRTQKDNSRLTCDKTKQNISNRIWKIKTPTPKIEGAGVVLVVPLLRFERIRKQSINLLLLEHETEDQVHPVQLPRFLNMPYQFHLPGFSAH